MLKFTLDMREGNAFPVPSAGVSLGSMTISLNEFGGTWIAASFLPICMPGRRAYRALSTGCIK